MINSTITEEENKKSVISLIDSLKDYFEISNTLEALKETIRLLAFDYDSVDEAKNVIKTFIEYMQRNVVPIYGLSEKDIEELKTYAKILLIKF